MERPYRNRHRRKGEPEQPRVGLAPLHPSYGKPHAGLTIAPSSEFGALATNTVEAAKVTTNLRIITSPGFALWQLCPSWDALSVMYITESAETPLLLCVCFGKVKSNARPDQLITFTRCLREALPIEYRDLPAAARNQTGTF